LASNREVVIIMGYPGAGKTSTVAQYHNSGHVRLNRDTVGGTLDQLHKLLDQKLAEGEKRLVLDNTYGTKASRAAVVKIGKKHGVPVKCVHLATSIEDAQVNVCMRMMQKWGRILTPEEIAREKDPAAVPATALFLYRKQFEKPTKDEGFSAVETVKFVRRIDPSYTKEAVLLDLDGSVRECEDPNQKYPHHPSQVRVLPRRAEKIKADMAAGKLVFGITNQGDIGRGKLTEGMAKECFDETLRQLGVGFEILYCPHNPMGGIKCYCRKPMPGFLVYLIEKHKLNRAKTVMVGDMKTDRTFAERGGVKFVPAEEYFK
jgi:HAD superfamily hydrolase (TIGR01662 family)